MKVISNIEEVKSIQLEILSAFDCFCREMGINYYLIDGTLLGAIRHKGYIPWDDDIDVALDRKNYERLIQEFPDLYKGNYRLYSVETNPRWDRAYACVSDERTQLVYDGNSSYATGLLIDVFPIDEVPNSPIKWGLLKKRMQILSLLSALKASSTFYLSKSFVKNLLATLLKSFLFPVSLRTIAEQKNVLAKSNNGKGYQYGYEVAFGLGAKNRFKMSDFAETTDITFEGRLFMAPKNYDSVLKDTYGDYLQLPPESERVSHHSFKAFWK